ncbi:MAG: HAD-IA family hydrolase [Thermoanaerobaculia bacterium]
MSPGGARPVQPIRGPEADRTGCPVRGVTFDVNGTLLRPRDLGAVYREVFRRHGLAVEAADDEVTRVVRRVWEELACLTDGSTDRFAGHPEGPRGWWRRFAERVAEHLGVPPPSRFAFQELYDRFARADAWTLFPDAPPALEALVERGVARAVVSNWDERLPRLLEAVGLAGRLDAIVHSSAVGYEKPDPRVFRAALERLEVEAGEALHVGDRLKEDVEGAVALGMRGVLLDRAGEVREPPEPAVAVIQSLEELPAVLDRL